MCFSDATPGEGGRAKKNILYNATPGGTRSMPMPSLKKWNTWGQVQGTPGGEVKGTPGGEVGIHKGDN